MLLRRGQGRWGHLSQGQGPPARAKGSAQGRRSRRSYSQPASPRDLRQASASLDLSFLLGRTGTTAPALPTAQRGRGNQLQKQDPVATPSQPLCKRPGSSGLHETGGVARGWGHRQRARRPPALPAPHQVLKTCRQMNPHVRREAEPESNARRARAVCVPEPKPVRTPRPPEARVPCSHGQDSRPRGCRTALPPRITDAGAERGRPFRDKPGGCELACRCRGIGTRNTTCARGRVHTPVCTG